MDGDGSFLHGSFEFGRAGGRERLHVGIVGVAKEAGQDVALMRLLLVGDKVDGIHVFPSLGGIT